MSYQDKNLTCSDCDRLFVYGAKDQELSGELGYDRPGRCRTCWGRLEDRRRDGDSSVTPSSLRKLRPRIAPSAALTPSR